jgi:hypothetical protein
MGTLSNAVSTFTASCDSGISDAPFLKTEEAARLATRAPFSVRRQDQLALRVTTPSGHFSSPEPNTSAIASPVAPVAATAMNTDAPSTTIPVASFQQDPQRDDLLAARLRGGGALGGQKREAPTGRIPIEA